MLTERLLAFSIMGAEWVLWLLMTLSLFSLAIVGDRLILFLRTREDIHQLEPALLGALRKGDITAAQREVGRDSLVRNVLRAGLDILAQGRKDPAMVGQAMMGAMAKERARYESRLTFLGTVGNNAPFVGLFGTVLGIIQAFHQMGKMDASQAASNQIVMTAISEALIATAVGILVAIPAVAAFNWAKSSIAGRMKQAEALMGAVLSGLSSSGSSDEGR